MKINKVVIRNFKRFREEAFDLDGNVVVAGPNNCGKTTLLQAIATWSLALERWRELNNYKRHRRWGTYSRAPIARQAFFSVPLRTFDLLWHERSWEQGSIEIEITFDNLTVPIQIEKDSSEQVYVRPTEKVPPDRLQDDTNFFKPVFIPAMTGLGTEEPVYQQPKISQLLGQGKPGDVLRNLLVEANHDQAAWEKLTISIDKMFGYDLLPPETEGPNIIAEYQRPDNGARYDIASAGSGFLQVLMLMTFLHSRPGTVLLLDEPDAHLHVILQDVIYSELRAAARATNSQLIIATHSEVVINAVDPRELCALVGKPKKLADNAERESLILSLSALSNMDLMLAQEKGRILYVEGRTDLDILRAWALVLNHRIAGFLERPFWKPAVSETRPRARGVKGQDHFESLLLAENEMRAVQLTDRDGKENMPSSQTALDGKLLKLCWKRYEIESYLIHPAVLARFVGKAAGVNAPLADENAMDEAMRKYLPGAVVDEPEGDHSFLDSTKAKNILSDILEEANLHGFPGNRYYEIAEVMQPDEIHPEATAMLDAIADHFNLPCSK